VKTSGAARLRSQYRVSSRTSAPTCSKPVTTCRGQDNSARSANVASMTAGGESFAPGMLALMERSERLRVRDPALDKCPEQSVLCTLSQGNSRSAFGECARVKRRDQSPTGTPP
jgi:hypothetical protein